MKKNVKLIVALAMTAQVLAGCGAAGNAEEIPEAKTPAAETETAEETADTPETEESGTAVDASETEEAEDTGDGVQEELTPDPTNLSYLEEVQVGDLLGGEGEYPLYAPKDGETMMGFFFYSDHGIIFTANAMDLGDQAAAVEGLQEFMKESVDLLVEEWQEDPDCSDIGVGETLGNGDYLYLFVTATAKDSYGTPYQRTELVYMYAENGVVINWDMEVKESELDEETMPLINEVGRCYGVRLDELAMEDGEWAGRDAQRREQEEQEKAQEWADRQDVYEPEEGEPVLEKVEGYQYLGLTPMTFLLDEENFTCPVLVPMGWNVDFFEHSVSSSMHGVHVQIEGDYTSASQNYQRMTQKGADRDFKYRSDPEEENRNVRLIEMMPMKGQEAGVYYVVEYDKKGLNGDEYYKRADLKFCIQVKEHYFIIGTVNLVSEDYDSKTNVLIKELETAYGFDLSEWYAQEDMQ